MGVKTFEGTATPLSGWHWVCPCGWSAHDASQPPLGRVQSHRANHIHDIVQLRRASAGEGSYGDDTPF